VASRASEVSGDLGGARVCSDYLYKRSGSPPPNREEEASLVLFQFAPLPRSEHRNACDKCAERVRDRVEGICCALGRGWWLRLPRVGLRGRIVLAILEVCGYSRARCGNHRGSTGSCTCLTDYMGLVCKLDGQFWRLGHCCIGSCEANCPCSDGVGQN
jgi:hypothetical protein